jgi:hypothetical protein
MDREDVVPMASDFQVARHRTAGPPHDVGALDRPDHAFMA